MYEMRAIPIEEIHPCPRNPKSHPADQVEKLVRYIHEFGFTNPILVDESATIIAGHGRLMAAKQVGMKEVPCVTITGLSEDEKTALRIADNVAPEGSEWDFEILSEELKALEERGYATDMIGFDDDFLKDLTGAAFDEAKGVDGDPDFVPDTSVDTVTKPGDVWVLGDHRVMCGSATSEDDVAALMAGHAADMWLTDPPYNVGYVGKTAEALTIQNDSMEDSGFRRFLVEAYSAADGVMRPGAVFYIWHADSEGFNFRGACRDVEWAVRQCVVWVKQHFVLGRQDYHWQHEPCLYGWKEGAAHTWSSDRKQTTTFNFDRPARSDSHPTMKPVALFEYQVRNSTVPGDLVLDSFGGSGTTLIACQSAGRRANLMELDPKYCDVIVRRYIELTGGEVHKEGGGAFEA